MNVLLRGHDLFSIFVGLHLKLIDQKANYKYITLYIFKTGIFRVCKLYMFTDITLNRYYILLHFKNVAFKSGYL